MKFASIFLFCFIGSISSNALPPPSNDNFTIEIYDKKIHPFVKKGNNTLPHEFPWMIGLLRWSTDQLFCDATLINDRWILTAAHCVASINAEELEVVIGAHDISYLMDIRLQNSVEEIIIHEDYHFVENDIALIKLKYSIIYTKLIKPIDLISKSFEEAMYFEQCLILGWGQKEDNMPSLILQKYEINKDDFLDREDELGPFLHVRNRDVNGGAWFGDSGGPLQCLNGNDGKWYQIGIISHGIRNREGLFSQSVFTNIHYYLDWIEEKIDYYPDYYPYPEDEDDYGYDEPIALPRTFKVVKKYPRHQPRKNKDKPISLPLH